METSKFVISLDFELHWGVFDSYGDTYQDNILGARTAIPQILELFEKYDVKATWATVGLLFNESINDYHKYKPALLPSYKEKKLNAFDVPIGSNEEMDKLHYGYSLIEKIAKCPGQEIGCHSYSHYYCQAEGQTIEEFSCDIRSAMAVSDDKFGIKMKSYVFPKNMVSKDYLKVLRQNSFSIYREASPAKFKYNSVERVYRLLNSYLKLAKGKVNRVVIHDGIKSIIGDRFLRPYNSVVLNYLMLRRIKNEMTFAAKNGSVYHLWWHPHNFGINLHKNLNNLESILSTYAALNDKYDMRSVCMADL